MMVNDWGFLQGEIEIESTIVTVEQDSENDCELSALASEGRFTLRRSMRRVYKGTLYIGSGFVSFTVRANQPISHRVAANALRKAIKCGTVWAIHEEGHETTWAYAPR